MICCIYHSIERYREDFGKLSCFGMWYPAYRACIELGLSSFSRGIGMEERGPPLLTITLACVPLVPVVLCNYIICRCQVLHKMKYINGHFAKLHAFIYNYSSPYLRIFSTTDKLPDAEFSTGSVWALRVNRIRQKGALDVQGAIDFKIGIAWWDDSTLGKKQETMDLKLWCRCSFLAEAQLEVLKTSKQI